MREALLVVVLCVALAIMPGTRAAVVVGPASGSVSLDLDQSNLFGSHPEWETSQTVTNVSSGEVMLDGSIYNPTYPSDNRMVARGQILGGGSNPSVVLELSNSRIAGPLVPRMSGSAGLSYRVAINPSSPNPLALYHPPIFMTATAAGEVSFTTVGTNLLSEYAFGTAYASISTSITSVLS